MSSIEGVTGTVPGDSTPRNENKGRQDPSKPFNMSSPQSQSAEESGESSSPQEGSSASDEKVKQTLEELMVSSMITQNGNHYRKMRENSKKYNH